MANIISNFFLLLTLTSLEINLSKQISWKTESRTIHVCKGNTADLIWDFDEEGNSLSKLEWYFNDNLLIWVMLDTEKIIVEHPYQGRIEKLGKSSIRLKNISLDDEGRFTLFPVISMSTSESIQTISLQVIEPPTDKCKCKSSSLGHPLKYTCDCSSPDCGRPHMSAIWKRSKTFEVLGEGNDIVITSSFHDNEIICCPQGIAMDCVGYFSSKFCTPIPLQDHESSSKAGNNTLQRDTATKQVPQCSDPDRSIVTDHEIAVLLITSVTVTIVGTTASVAIFSITCRIIKKNQDLVAAMKENFLESRHNDLSRRVHTAYYKLIQIPKCRMKCSRNK